MSLREVYLLKKLFRWLINRHFWRPFCCWNDRRSSRVFLCFYSAIFKLTGAMFQTCTYNYGTVRSSHMKFWQQFEVNKLYVCTKFRGNKSRDLGFRTRKPPKKFGVKTALIQKRLMFGKNTSHGYVLRYPFFRTNPLLAAMSFFLSFFLFFLPKSCTHFCKTPKHWNLIFVLIELQTQFCLPKFFGYSPRNPTKMGPQKSIFWKAQARVPVFFDIRR